MSNQKRLRIHFTASIAASKQYRSNYNHIIDYVNRKGHNMVADHIMGITENEIGMEGREERLAFHSKIESWINECDGMIAETSFPSISVGYEISLALRVGKPVLVLYSEGQPPSLLAHHKDEKLLCEKYTIQTLPTILDDFLHYIQGKSDLRFTFFITPKIASYLDMIAKKDKLPKSVYLRKLIERDIEGRSK